MNNYQSIFLTAIVITTLFAMVMFALASQVWLAIISLCVGVMFFGLMAAMMLSGSFSERERIAEDEAAAKRAAMKDRLDPPMP